MMYAYVTCRPDIGYAITLLSKFSSSPAEYHYACLKNIARYLRATKTWGIRYLRSCCNDDLELNTPELLDAPDNDSLLPKYPEDI